jgi:hypothetical protein
MPSNDVFGPNRRLNSDLKPIADHNGHLGLRCCGDFLVHCHRVGNALRSFVSFRQRGVLQKPGLFLPGVGLKDDKLDLQLDYAVLRYSR